MPTVAAAEVVGAAAAVRPASTGTPPGGASRTLQIGTDISAQERIETSASGSLQVMFVDKSTLTIGPNSNLLIDEFVYNAGGGTGQFAASLTKGALRFVGGQISHTAGATINTPAATIGIRGGSALITHDSECDETKSGDCTKVVCIAGECTVVSRIDAQRVQLKISQAVEIGALGVTAPFTATTVNLGDNTVTAGTQTNRGGGIAARGFTSQEEIDRAKSEQTREPVPPPP
jgi:hypothetical protein